MEPIEDRDGKLISNLEFVDIGWLSHAFSPRTGRQDDGKAAKAPYLTT